MLFEEKTLNNIMIDLKRRVKDDISTKEGTLIDHSFRGAAAEFEQVYIELWTVDQNGYAETADREHLILRAKERGLTPFPASHAVWKAVFNCDVQVNSRFSAEDLTYICIGKEDGAVLLMCEQAGTKGNKKQKEITEIEFIEGFETGELLELRIPGEDEEETEDFRRRYLDSFDANAFGGNRADYLEKTNSIPGVGRTKVTRIWNQNISPTSMIPTERVIEWYNKINSTLESEVKYWLDMVYHAAKEKMLTTGGTVLLTIIDSDFGVASDTLVQTVQTIMDPEINAGEGYGLAPIGHMVMVQSAKPKEVMVKTNLIFEMGYGWNNLKGIIEEAIASYLIELRKDWAENDYLVVRIKQIENHILNIPGIVDIEGTLINEQPENLVLEPYEIPMFGGINV